jgi:integrase
MEKFTQSRIDALKCAPGHRDARVFDKEQPGLAVRITATGSKSYQVQYTFHGQKRRVPLGNCMRISLSQARAVARAIMGDVAKGKDPVTERREAAKEAQLRSLNDAYTLDRMLSDWQALHLATKRQRYSTEAVRALRHAFGGYLNLPANDLERGAVRKVLDKMVQGDKRAMAARTAAYGKAAYGWAIKRGTLAENPFASLPVAATERRERVLTDNDELAAIWRSTGSPGPFNGIVRMLILTGQRREEVAGMTWAELSDDGTTWTIPAARAKNGATHIVPLGLAAQELLRSVPHYSEFVFTGLRGPFNGWSKAKATLDAKSGVTNWRLHDIRRTVATGLQRLGVRLEVTEQILNHISGSRAGIVGIYQRHDFAAEKRAAIDAWGAHVLAIIEGREAAGNVVALRA